MTLVSLERIKNYIQTQINPYGKPFKGTAYEFGIKLLDYLNNKDADYDVDKVIEELRKKQNNKGFGGTLQEIFYDSGLEDAIEIVQSNGCVKTTLKKDNNGWIPRSERLPEIKKDVLAAVKYNGFMGMYGTWMRIGHLESDNEWLGDCIGGKVIAWQPLPEPYREEQKDE